jgi:hypothetical protein
MQNSTASSALFGEYMQMADSYGSLGITYLTNVGRFLFTPPLEVVIDMDEDMFTLDCEEGDFHEIGATKKELMDALAKTLEFVWNEYARAGSEKMTPDAKAYKKWLMTNMILR